MRRLLAVVPALLLVLAGCGDDVDRPLVGEPVPDETGMKYVGASGVVIAIPDAWSLDDSGCPFVRAPRTYQVRAVMTAPPSDLDEVCDSGETDGPPTDVLRIAPGGGLLSVQRPGDPAPAAPGYEERDGFAVSHEVTCDEDRCGASWVVEDPGVTLTVEVPRDGGREAIAAMDTSLRPLPPGWTTSPADGTVVPDE